VLEDASLAFVFASKAALTAPGLLEQVRRLHPRARLLGCSTAGEIRETQVLDESMVVTAVAFDSTRVEACGVKLSDTTGSFDAGARLAKDLPNDGLVHVFVLSDGHDINGTALVQGLTSALPEHVQVTGGLAGDGASFGETLVLLDAQPESGCVAAVGFYGDRLDVGCGSFGGWDPFGPERLITRSAGNVLYELDGQSALGLYKRYLGDQAVGLPAAALLFPLSLRTHGGETSVVRTILSVDESSESMTFAGDVPRGSLARLMKANFDRLIDGAGSAARSVRAGRNGAAPGLALLISCVGRKLVLKQRVEEEVECVREVLGDDTMLAGFYSYGEISPFTTSARCELHNQTMTITTLHER
jgi:hypothetical protein